ncbi:MAG: CoA activase [Firmicutes bacterium]|nr:CoA activase [Bacillota bacterium]
MHTIGIDIGSSCAKTAVTDGQGNVLWTDQMPTGWSSLDAAEEIRRRLNAAGYDPENAPCIATGYGRVVVPYAEKAVTEITCHAKGAQKLFSLSDLDVIDIGGQDTKVICVRNGSVRDFLMNDKCSAGTGRFLEVMANTLAMDSPSLIELAGQGSDTSISSMCTVFAESEVISLIGRGERKENIAFAVVSSIAKKIASQASRICGDSVQTVLTGGLCEADELRKALEKELGRDIASCPDARYAGAIGAALLAEKL